MENKDNIVLPNLGGFQVPTYGTDTPYKDRVKATRNGTQCSYTIPEFTEFLIKTKHRGGSGFSVTIEATQDTLQEALDKIEEAKRMAAGKYPLEVEVIVAA